MKTSFDKKPSFTDSMKPAKDNTAKAKRRGRFSKTSAILVSKDAKTIVAPIQVKIVVDDLAKEKVEAIVNTVSQDLDLSKNPCAKALSDAAGPGLEQECKGKGQLSIGRMVVTDGYNLCCKHVFHVAAGDWEKGKGEAVLRSLIQSCLKEADKRKFSTIAFPAIGTGKAGFPRNIVAKAFFEEAESFKNKNPKSTVNEVRLVIFPKDKPTIKAFQDEEKNNLAKKNPGNGEGKISVGERYQNPQKGVSHFGSVRLEVVSGDITKQTTDAIAIASNKNLKVSVAGIVGKNIDKKGGPSIQEECNQLLPQNTGSVVHTSAGSLPTKTIFHLVFDHQKDLSSTELINAMFKCFKEADSIGITSIAVPAIGTGGGKMSPKDAAKAILSAVINISQENPTSLNHIRIVVFKNDMIEAFYKATEEAKAPASMWQSFKGILGFGEVKDASAHLYQSYTTKDDRSGITTPAMNEKMWLQIFASSDQDLNEAESKLIALVKEKSRKEEIHHEAIGTLSDSQNQRIMQFETTHNTTIQIDKKVNRIVVRGDFEDVFNATLAITKILNEKSKEEDGRKFAELLSLNVQWACVYDGEAMPYSIEINAAIEHAYECKEPFVVINVTEGDDTCSCKIDFTEMTETNLETNETIQVERIVKTAGIRVPGNWDPQPSDSDGKEQVVHLVLLDQNSKEYDDVKEAVEKTVSPTNIIKIERVQNPSRYRAYMVKKQELDDKNGSNEKKLFHGTDPKTCNLINFMGFNRSYCGKNATFFGRGVYFARDAAYSMNTKYSPPDSSGNRYIYLVNVLAGEYTQGSAGTISPPPKDPNVPTITYDSVVDDVSNPSIYVIFHDDQNYPEYLITFQ